jgi:hypothetical protein
MSYFGVITASSPVLYWTLQETGSGGPRWDCTDFGRYGTLSGTVSGTYRVYQVNMTATMPDVNPYYGKGWYAFTGSYPVWGSPAGQNPSGAFSAPGTAWRGPQTGVNTGSNFVALELTGVFNLSSSWSVEWWQGQPAGNIYGARIGFLGSSGSTSVGWLYGFPNGNYVNRFDMWWASGSTTAGSVPATTGSRWFQMGGSAMPWPWPWLTPASQGFAGYYHFVLIWRGLGTLSGSVNNGANFDVYLNGLKQLMPAGSITWGGTGEPVTGSQLWWTNSTFIVGTGEASSGATTFAHVSVYDRELTAEDIVNRYLALSAFAFTGSIGGLSGSGSFNQASGSYMINSVQRPTRNLVAPRSGTTGRADPRARKTNPGTN